MIGYNVFDDKIVEINYDKSVLIIHSTLPDVRSYHKYDLTFKAGLSYLKIVLNNGIKKMEGLFDFDTGSSETMFLTKEFTALNNLYTSLKKTGTDKLKGGGANKIAIDKVQLPGLLIGSSELKNINIGIEAGTSQNGPQFNILGNDILKRFNAIIDYKNDVVYLKQNSLFNNLYLYQKIVYIKWSVIIFVMILIAVLALFLKRKKRMHKMIIK